MVLILLTPAVAHPLLWFAALSGSFVALNHGLLGLTYTEGGFAFALRSCLMSWFGYLYSGAGLIVGLILHITGKIRFAIAD